MIYVYVSSLLRRLFRNLLGKEDLVDIGQHATGGNGHASEQTVELLIIANRELDVTRNDTALLVVASGVARKLEDLRRQVLEHRSKVDRGTRPNALRIPSRAKEACDTSNGELQPSFGGTRHRLDTRLLATSTLTHSRHCGIELWGRKILGGVFFDASVDFRGRKHTT